MGSQTAGIHSPPDCRMTCSADVRRVLKDKILILLATEKITEGGIKIRQQNRLEISLICNIKTARSPIGEEVWWKVITLFGKGELALELELLTEPSQILKKVTIFVFFQTC